MGLSCVLSSQISLGKKQFQSLCSSGAYSAAVGTVPGHLRGNAGPLSLRARGLKTGIKLLLVPSQLVLGFFQFSNYLSTLIYHPAGQERITAKVESACFAKELGKSAGFSHKPHKTVTDTTEWAAGEYKLPALTLMLQRLPRALVTMLEKNMQSHSCSCFSNCSISSKPQTSCLP